MTVKLIKIGSSRGIRIPKTLIDKFDLSEELEMEILGDGILLKKSSHPRSGWHRKILDEIQEGGTPPSLMSVELDNDFDQTEWQW